MRGFNTASGIGCYVTKKYIEAVKSHDGSFNTASGIGCYVTRKGGEGRRKEDSRSFNTASGIGCYVTPMTKFAEAFAEAVSIPQAV